MAKLLLIGLVFFISVSVNNAVDLIPICKNSTFMYSGTEVNGIYKLEYSRSFMQTSNYKIDEQIDFSYYFDEEFHQKTMNLFRAICNGQTSIEHCKLMRLRFACKEEMRKTYYDEVIMKVKNLSDLHITLESLYQNKFDPNIKASDEDTNVENMVKSLNLYDKQTLIFQQELIDDMYNAEILSLDRFIFDEMSSTLIMNIFVPFNDENFNVSDDAYGCITSQNLPLFYQKN